ncbi:carboxylesterase family protein [Cellulomonas sp. P5_E12]
MRTSRRGALVAILGAAALTITAVPASAGGNVEVTPYSNSNDWTYNDCGYPVSVHEEITGTYKARAGKKDNETFYYVTDSFSYRQVHTRVDTGQWYVRRGNQQIKDMKATRVEGTVFQSTLVVKDSPGVIEDSAGKVVQKDRGVIKFEALWDTGGDTDPGKQFLELISATVRGPHPGFDQDYCKVPGDLVGTGSADRMTLKPVGSTGSASGYMEYLPPDYAAPTKSPLLVFLHGYGESGDGSADQLPLLEGTAIPRFIANDGWAASQPFVVLAPQHAPDDGDDVFSSCDGLFQGASCVMAIQHELGNVPEHSPCMTPQEVDAFLTYAIAAYDVDPSRVYLTGLSCGAYGVWSYLETHGNETVAAAVPIAGDGRPMWGSVGCALGKVPLWAFAGDADDTVNPAGSIEPVANINTCPPPAVPAQVTIYPGADHDSWTQTYTIGAANDIYSWMLSHTHT